MNKEICDYYEPRMKYKDKMCRYFTGNINNKAEISKCRYNCSIIDCQSLMQHNSYRRGRGGVIKQKK